MKKLKILLSSKKFCFFILIFALFQSFFRIHFDTSRYSFKTTKITGIVLQTKTNGNQLSFIIEGKEKVQGYYYVEKKEELKYIQVGEKIQIEGTLSKPNKNRNFDLWDYELDYKGKQIHYIMNVKKITKISSPKGLYKIKNEMIKRIETFSNASYLYAFLLGDSSKLQKRQTYQDLGISHLLAVSGMHITFLTSILSFLCSFFISNKKVIFFITIPILVFYLFLLGWSATALRAFYFYLFTFINQTLKLKCHPLQIFLYTFSILLFQNPFFLYQIGFQFSFCICFFLLLMPKEKTTYIKSLLKTSCVAFLASLPISIYYFHTVHFGSICFNLIAVPFVTFLLFPLTIFTFLFPFLEPFFNMTISIFHILLSFFNLFSFLKVSFCTIDFSLLLLYPVLLLFTFQINKYFIFIFLFVLFFHFTLPYQSTSYFIDMIDVGQGDSILIRFPHLSKTVLIDTGGIMQYGKEDWQIKNNNLTNSILIPYFRSLGVGKIDFLILTHGDFDHMGEAINLVNHFKIKRVIFNNDELNELEQSLMNVLNKKKIKYDKNLKQIKIKKNKLYFLNTRIYDNENDNSNVIYFKVNDYKFLFMGDASIEREKDILKKYHLENIDFFKVGHHGSDTSSSQYFIDTIRPKNCLISVGKNNRYGHPKQTVLDILNNCHIYRTDINGGIRIKVNHKYIIKTVNS